MSTFSLPAFSLAKTFKNTLIVLSLVGLTAAVAGEASARGFGGGGARGGGGFRGGSGGGHFGGFRGGGFRGGAFRSGGFRGGHFGGFRGGFGHHHHFGWNRSGWNRGWGWNRYSWNYRRPWYPSYRPYYPVYRPSYPVVYPSYNPVPAYVPPAPVYVPPAPAYVAPAPAVYAPPPAPPPAIANPTYLTIQFQQAVSAADVTNFLNSYNVKLADGPSQDGTYRVLVHQGPVPQDQLNQLVESMRGQTTIVAQVSA